MENASKALIIAGAILIAIMIITLGIAQYYSLSSSVKKNATLTEQEVSSFNSKITPYVGKNISGSQVKALISTARSMNSSAINEGDTTKRVEIYFSTNKILYVDSSNKIQDSSSSYITTNKYYKVESEYGAEGLITKITITE